MASTTPPPATSTAYVENPRSSTADTSGNNIVVGDDEEKGLSSTKNVLHDEKDARRSIWTRMLSRHDRRWVGWRRSAWVIANSSFLNLFLIFLPFAWAAHFVDEWKENHALVFALCFLTIIPLEKLFDWGGEQLAMYCGEDLGDLIIITFNNAVEVTLAIILLLRCDLKLLQSTIVGVVLLHLLLIPGTSFLTGGVRIWQQHLDEHRSQLNHTLLIIGVMSLVVPLGFFTALGRGATSTLPGAEPVLTDAVRGDFLRMARGTSVLLLLVYICSRVYLHKPPAAITRENEPLRNGKKKFKELEDVEPEINPYAALLLLVVAVALMAVTAEFLVDSIEFVRERSNIQEEWFGLVLLPLVSFSADATVAIVYFVRSTLRRWLGEPSPPSTLAEDRAIDLSIQFTLFWTPFLVLLGWWTNKPFTLLFDLFEVTALVASCFLVNYVTADAKTNWAEGTAMVAFYTTIGLSAWYYTGQPEIRIMAACKTSVAAALSGGVSAEGG